MAEVFQRYEEKYLISAPQYAVLFEALAPYMKIDAYGKTAIGSLYFDTPDFYLIRTSLEKPVYKEKLRLRSYGRPGPHSPAFVELKKSTRVLFINEEYRCPINRHCCSCSKDIWQKKDRLPKKSIGAFLIMKPWRLQPRCFMNV